MFLRLSLSLSLCRQALANQDARGGSREREGGKTRGGERSSFAPKVPRIVLYRDPLRREGGTCKYMTCAMRLSRASQSSTVHFFLAKNILLF